MLSTTGVSTRPLVPHVRCAPLQARAPPFRCRYKPRAAVVCIAGGSNGVLPSTWSNPKGEVLSEIVPGKLWAAQRPFVWNGIDVGGKMAVVRCEDGGLWVHSPVALDADLKAELAAIGDVAHIVSPNFEHVKYAPEWIKAFPDANAYGCPGLQADKPDIAYTATIGSTIPETWPSEIEACFLDFETNPFTGKPFFNEVVFFHRLTKTFMVTDAFWNYPQDNVPASTVFWKKGMDKVYLPFYRKLMLKGKEEAFYRAMDTIREWPFERVLPCHGTVIETGARAAFEDHMLKGIPQDGQLGSTMRS